MKTLVVFYSRTNLTKKVALKIAEALGADLEEIIDKDKRRGVLGYLRSGREAMQQKLAKIEPLLKNQAEYDLIIIGTPIWAYTMSAPIRTFLMPLAGRLKKIALFATQGGSGGERALAQIEDLAGASALAKLIVTSKEVAQDNYQDKLQLFINQINHSALKRV